MASKTSGTPAPRAAVDAALLLLRVGISASMLAFHGWGKITGGPERWERIGGAMSNLGIDVLPTFWGFLAAISESLGSVLLAIGLLTRPSAFLLAGTMGVAAIGHLMRPEGTPGAGLAGASHALELMVVYLALLLTGAGRYSLDRWLRSKRKR